MSDALRITGADLVRALGGVTPAVDEAVRARAEARAAELASDGITTRVLKRGKGSYAVEVTGEGLFEQQFGRFGAER
jgi:hypothetical protein